MKEPRGLILQHGLMDPPALLADWLRDRSIAFDVVETWHAESEPPLDGYDFVAVLGSAHSATQDDPPWIPAVRATVGRALERELPVFGACFGAQVLALELGGEVSAAAVAEIGWRTIETDDPSLIPEGPWLHWHFEAFSIPPGATELARSASCSQAFRSGPNLGVQFHPEATAEIAESWADEHVDYLRRIGMDGSDFRRAEDHPDQLRGVANELFAGWWRLAFGATGA